MHYTPEFKGPIEGWVVNHLRTNYWKVGRTMAREDVLQEAYLVFLRCKQKYPKMDTPQHFMSLFKTSWSRQFINFANADTESRVLTEMPIIRTEDGDVELDVAGERDNDGYLSVLLSQAPAEVLLVLNLFLQAPQELLEIALSSWVGKDRRCRAGGSKKINQMLGLPTDLDVMQITEDYFKQNH